MNSWYIISDYLFIFLQPYLRRRKYKLYGAFFSATMIHPIDTPIEFEVSMGNYGNKLDNNAPVQSSTTPPSNLLYDGKAYHYLPWFEQKPCVVVDSQWEDCSYRIISMNILLNVADKLVREYVGGRMGCRAWENEVIGTVVKVRFPVVLCPDILWKNSNGCIDFSK